MSGYRKNFNVTVNIDGKDHELTLRQMTVDESIDIHDAGESVSGVDEKRTARLLKARQLLPDAVVKIEPAVVDADGAEIGIQELFGAAYFAGYLTNAITQWATKAVPSNPQ